MKIVIPVCIICEATDVEMWTLDNGKAAAVTYVCTEHAEPLRTIVDASQGLPLEFQLPLVQRKTAGKQNVQRAPREIAEEARAALKMVPLNWTPPAGMPTSTAKRESAEARAATRAAIRAEQEAAKAEREARATARRAEKEAEREARAAAKAERAAAEDRLVREARAQGKTWDEVAVMAGTTRQSVWSRYHNRYRDKGPKSAQQVALPAVDGDVDVPVDLPEDAAEVGAGADGDDVVPAGAGEVHDLGLQSLEGGDALDGLKKNGRGTLKRADAGVVVDHIEVA